MADADRAMKTTRDDAQVFQLLAEAQRQYEQYLAITQNAAVFSPVNRSLYRRLLTSHSH